jgi:predicted acyl esterase
MRPLVLALGLLTAAAVSPAPADAPQRTETRAYVLGLDAPSRSLYYLSCDQAPYIGGTCFSPPPGAESVSFRVADATTTSPGAQIRFLAADATRLALAEQCAPSELEIPAGTDRIQVLVNGASNGTGACPGVGTTGNVTATWTMQDPGDPEPEVYTPSAPIYETIAERKRYVPSGGNQIQVDVYRPNASGTFPVLVWFDVYYKDDTGAVVNDERDYFVSRGYVFVHASSPGSNTSGGSYENAFGPVEQRAAYDVVEWAGVQPWSNGRVAMEGLSYAAIIEYFVAAMRPPHLVTIYPTSAYSDLYRDLIYTGGNLQAGYPILWDANNRSVAFAPPQTTPHDPADVPKMATGYATSLAGYRPLIGDFAWNQYDNDFYAARSPATRNHLTEIPVAIDVGWHDDMVHGGPLNYETLGSDQKRMIIGPWGHSEAHRRADGRFQRLRWFDHHLKGLASGVMEDPKVQVFIPRGGSDDAGSWLTSTSWPLPSTSIATLNLSHDSMSPSPTTPSTRQYLSSPTRHAANVTDVSYEESIRFTSPPLTSDVTVVGYSELILFARTSAHDTSFTVTVSDVAPDGSAVRLRSGWLRASMLTVDEVRSRPGRPVHTFTDRVEVPIDELVEYRIGIWPFANTFPAGHSIRVEVSDLARGPGGAPFLAPPYPAINILHVGGDHGSRLLLPTI